MRWSPVDNLVTGVQRNIGHEGRPRFVFLRHDVSEPLYLDGPVDAILHFASPASPVDFLRMPIQILKVNSLGTYHALGMARAKGARFLLASTSEVYGDPQVHPQTEDYHGNVNPIGPRGAYDEAKRFAEAMTMAYHRIHGVDTRIVRIFNTYGPRMRLDDGRVVPNFVEPGPARRASHGLRRRHPDPLVHLRRDLVDGIVRLLASDTPLPVNLGNPNEMTILAFAEHIIAATGNQGGLEFLELPESRRATRATMPRHHSRPRAAGLGAAGRPDEGMAETIGWFRAELGQ